jgi:hypothetical protein
MVKFNNIEMKIYDLDTEETIYDRLASIMNTLPKFLYFPNRVPELEDIYKNINIEVQDIRDVFKKNSITDIYKYIDTEKLLYPFSIYKIIYEYIIFNEEIDTLATHANGIEDGDIYIKDPKIDEIFQEIQNIKEFKKSDITKNTITNIWDSREGFKEDIEIKIQQNKDKWSDNHRDNKLATFTNFENLEEIKYTEFEEEKVKIKIELEIKGVSSILEIFNIIKLNTNVPFAVTHNFYKILKDFTPPIEWSNLFDRSKSFNDKYKNIDRTKNIIFRILENKIKNKYSEGILNIKDDIINVYLEYNIKNIKKEDVKNYKRILVNNFLNIFNIKNPAIPIHIYEVNGVFNFTNQSVNKYVLKHLILNNSIFSSLIGIQEKKIRELDSVYIFFENTKIGKITATITSKISDGKLFSKKSEYVRVKITKSSNIQKVNYFQTILSKLMTIYNNNKQEIIDIYKPFVDIDQEEEDNDIGSEEDNELDPNIFIKGYDSKCQKKDKITLISDEEAINMIENGEEEHVIKFPKEKIGDSIPRYYICNQEGIFPGLIENNLENKDVFPYVPCCRFKKSQVNTFKYKDYYNSEEVEESVKTHSGQTIYKNKILDNKTFGKLPENINKIFSIADKTGQYFRRGVDRNKNSFLSCIRTAIGKKSSNVDIIRDNLVRQQLAASCKQEMYNYTIEEILTKIEDQEEYFDPKLFIHLLEVEYNCNIFIFTYNNNGTLIIPNHINGYFRLKNTNPCIFIYEHSGSERSKAKYPQCELIVRQKDEKNEDIEMIFDYNNKISLSIINLFNKINSSYILNTKIQLNNIDLPWPDNIKITSQKIDSYGKARVINIILNGKNISILTDPIQPFNFIISNEIYKSDIFDALEILKILKIKSIKQLLNKNNIIQELNGILGNVNISILINGENESLNRIEVIQNIVEIEEAYNFKFNTSFMTEYNKYKKISRYVIEYLFWIFSKYLNEKNILSIKDITEDVYIDFKNNYILIDESFVYENVPKLFSMNNSGLIHNNKLIVKSIETLKRLFYVLRLNLQRNSKKILSYYNTYMIENYYKDITDFDQYYFQLILEGEKSISKLISEKNNKNIVYDKIVLKDKSKENTNKGGEDDNETDNEEDNEDNEEDNNEEDKENDNPWNIRPYFFKNKKIGNNQIYLAQNIDSYLKGIEISLIWNKQNYNPKTNVNDAELIPEFTLYSFINQNTIKKYNVGGYKNGYDIKILGYKIENNNLYTVLLPL